MGNEYLKTAYYLLEFGSISFYSIVLFTPIDRKLEFQYSLSVQNVQMLLK